MLRKGETAKSIQIKHKRNRESVVARARTLAEFLNNSKEVPAALLTACESQHRLAALNMPEYGIHPLSLNSLKHIANSVCGDDGWSRLEQLRHQMLKSRTSLTRALPARMSPAQAAAEAKRCLDESIRTRAILLKAYLELRKLIRPLAEHDDVLANQLKRHTSLYDQQLGLAIVKSGKRDG